MRPSSRSDDFFIPATLDVVSSRKTISGGKLVLGLLIIILSLIFAILILIFAAEGSKLLPAVAVFVGTTLFVRYFMFKESHFRKKRREILEHKYQYDYNMLWNIYEISEGYPTIVTFANGIHGMFVAFDKDIIVGKGENARYYHHEAISEAYNVMGNKHIDCIHIDYMDTVGKDERMTQLFASVKGCPNSDIRKVMNMIYGNVQNEMNYAYASYDVYLFLARDKALSFWDDMQTIIHYFKEANYVREHILTKTEIGKLVESIYNVEDFSVIRANEQVFAGVTKSNFIKVIWKEKDGVREVLSKTLQETQAEQRIRNAESGLRPKKKKKIKVQDTFDDDIFNS